MFTHHAFPGLKQGAEHDSAADESLLVIVQIESKSGVENVEKIAQVNGVDILFIGKYLLCFEPYS
jgi:4-hydroxy-2-oxoheptanedioate aldolase